MGSMQVDNNRYSFVQVRVEPIEYHEKPALAIFIDNVTQNIKLMQLQNRIFETRAKNESLENFTSTISHEFRTPLLTSLMYLSMLLKLCTRDTQQSKICSILHRQLSFLLSLVQDMLDLRIMREGILERKCEVF